MAFHTPFSLGSLIKKCSCESGWTISKCVWIQIVQIRSKPTKQTCHFVGFLLLDGLVVQSLKEHVQHQDVVSATQSGAFAQMNPTSGDRLTGNTISNRKHKQRWRRTHLLHSQGWQFFQSFIHRMGGNNVGSKAARQLALP